MVPPRAIPEEVDDDDDGGLVSYARSPEAALQVRELILCRHDRESDV